MAPEFVITALSVHLPAVMRYAGAIARRLRNYNVALGGKTSGSALTDALTLADLTIQELLVAALRDSDPIFRHCRIEAEEETGDLERLSKDSPLVIALDPIDGTKQYRDKTGDGYAVMLHLRSAETVLYSLVYVPEKGPEGYWLEANGSQILCGPDDHSRSANDVLRSMSPVVPDQRPRSKKIYLIGFQERDGEAARRVSELGLEGVDPDDMPGSIYELMARGEFAGSLIHSPNVYDFPVSLQLARMLGGDAIWAHSQEPVHFREMWLDDRADMLRLPGIVACADRMEIAQQLATLAQDWNRERYHGGASL